MAFALANGDFLGGFQSKSAGSSFSGTTNQYYAGASGSPLTNSLTPTVPAGTLVVVCVGADNLSDGGGTGVTNDVTSVTDSAGNTYTKAGEVSSNTSAGSGTVTAIFYSVIANAVQANVTNWTVNFSGSVTAKGAFILGFTMDTGSTVTVDAAIAQVANVTLSGLASTSSRLWVAGIAAEAPASTQYNISGTWNLGSNGLRMGTTGQGSTSNAQICVGYHIDTTTSKTASSSATPDPTALVVSFTEVPGGGGPTRRWYNT